MSFGRSDKPAGDNRDIEGDYKAAYIAEYTSYKTAGDLKRAAHVAEVLKKLGHDVNPPKPKEKAVPADTTEKAVEADAPVVTPKTEAKAAAEKPVEKAAE